MPFTRAGQLARPVPTARLDDPIALLAENLRNAPHGVLPVLDRPTFGEGDASEREARVLGLVDARDLSKIALPGALSEMEGEYLNGHAPRSLQTATAREVMRGDCGFIPGLFSLENALLTLERYDANALPVLDEMGRYRGVISRADVLSALARGVRPPLVGGMATPLGVWLTDGTRTGGAPPWGLFLTGVFMGVMLMVSQLVFAAVLWPFKPEWAAMAFSGRLGANELGGMFNLGATVLQALIFFGLFRLLPIAGVHAAEHQTVWALERGLPLEPEFVGRMPRAHPRCGTNLMVLGSLITIALTHAPSFDPLYITATLLAAFFFWRSLGTFVQENFTTRPASLKQLESGIRAASELLEKYQNEPFAQSPQALRLLNGGMLWAMAGILVTTFVLGFGMDWVTRVVLKLQ